MENNEPIVFSSDIYGDVFARVREAVQKSSRRPFLIAVDGRSGSGKTTLGYYMAKSLKATLLSMDDFYLPFNLRTPQTIKDPAGHMDLKRFLSEVLIPLSQNKEICYKPYNCQQAAFGKCADIKPANTVIVEGSYSMHPLLVSYYGFKIFVTADPKVQLKRVVKRNGGEDAQNFKKKWIPAEELYFKEHSVADYADYVLDTSALNG